MKTGEVEATIKRLIQRDEGIAPALRLLEQMLGTAISEKEAEELRRVIERRRIRLLAEAAVDGVEVDTAGMKIEDVRASLREMVAETDNPNLIRMADGVAATFGDDAAAGRMKPGGLRARRSGNVIVAPGNGVDQGFAAVNGENLIPVWLDDGEYIFSNKAIEGLGLRNGAPRVKARDVGLVELEKLHNELKALAATEPPAPPEEITADVGPAEPVMTPTELLAEAQIAEERRERAAVADETGRWHASDEFINAVIAAESGGDPNAVSEAGAVGLLQILPSTARDPGFGVIGLEGTDDEVVAQLKNPEINRRLGSEYLSAMLHRYHGDADLALVAYNAGPARADRVAKDERPLDRFVELNPKAALETLPYIKRVLGNV
ncbi:MAG: lytic transglycosylase domain-containing protein [Proteobacteria bacterium]|nr:lytic transglycosylase domain-containing protein [Pseudomonadota bacterium]